MKVTSTNNQRIMLAAIFAVVLTMILSLFKIIGFFPDVISIDTLYLLCEVAYLASILYLINILQHCGESVSIQTPFSIFLGLEIIGFISQLFFPYSAATLIGGVAMLKVLINIYIVIVAFKIKSEKISRPYRIFGISLIVSILLKFSLAFIPINLDRPLLGPGRFIGLIDIIPLLAILYLIIHTGKLLKETMNPQPDIEV